MRTFIHLLPIAAALLFSYGCSKDNPEDDITDTSNNAYNAFEMIRDPAFREHCQIFDRNRDGILSESEVISVEEILIWNDDAVSLEGIEIFTNLRGLMCYNNKLTSLDVSKNTQLLYLWCDGNQLTSLDLSKNTQLTFLDCKQNPLASLDVTKNTLLKTLICGDNQLTSLDISQNTRLEELFCVNNNLTNLDVSNNPELTYLYCYGNQLAHFDVSNNVLLKNLECYDNQLEELDVSQNMQLRWLWCHHNEKMSAIWVWNDFDIHNPTNSIRAVRKDTHTSFEWVN